MSNATPPPSADPAANPAASKRVRENLQRGSTWLRLFFMLVVTLLYSVSRMVLGVVVLLQFFSVLFSGETIATLGRLGQSLATYSYQVISYLTFNTEARPYPFDLDWPLGPPAPDQAPRDV